MYFENEATYFINEFVYPYYLSITLEIFTCSKLAMKTLEKGVKHI